MHPGFFGHWKRAHREHREAWREARAACGGRHHGHHGHHDGEEAHASGRQGHGHGHGGGPLFGVRRPLRFMAHKLDLDEEQVKALARILDDLKTERAQAAVDDRRTVGDFAAALEAESFEAEQAKAGLERRVESAKRVEEAVFAALERTHAMLRPEQRSKLAYLLRSGALTI